MFPSHDCGVRVDTLTKIAQLTCLIKHDNLEEV